MSAHAFDGQQQQQLVAQGQRGGMVPVIVETKEQAQVLAAQIIKDSGLSSELVSPGSARFMAHQILADHVIDTQKQELERLNTEIERLQHAVGGRGHQPAQETLAAPPAAAVPGSRSAGEGSCIDLTALAPAVVTTAEPPIHTDSMARPDSALVGSAAAAGGAGLTKDDLVRHLVSVLHGGDAAAAAPQLSQSQAQMSRHNSAALFAGQQHPNATANDNKRLSKELDELTHDGPVSMHVPNFTRLAAQTVGSVEAVGGVVPEALPQMRGVQRLVESPARNRGGGGGGAVVGIGTEAPAGSEADLDSTSTTLPPAPFSHHDPLRGREVDWSTVGQDVLTLLRELHVRQIDAEREKALLEEQLTTILASPRAVTDDVFESPVVPLDTLADDPQAFSAPATAAPPPALGAPAPPSDASAPRSVRGSRPASEVDAAAATAPAAAPAAAAAPASKHATPVASHTSAPLPVPPATPLNPQQQQHQHDHRRMSSSTAQSAVQGSFTNPSFVLPTSPPPPPARSVSGEQAAQSELPEGWRQYATSEGRPYYFNTATGKSHWRRPTAAAGKPLMINININVDKRKKRASAASLAGGAVQEQIESATAAASAVDATPRASPSHAGVDAASAAHVETIVHTQDTAAATPAPHASAASIPPPSMLADQAAAPTSAVPSQRASLAAPASRAQSQSQAPHPTSVPPSARASVAASAAAAAATPGADQSAHAPLSASHPLSAAAAAMDSFRGEDAPAAAAATAAASNRTPSQASHPQHPFQGLQPQQLGSGTPGFLSYTVDDRTGSPLIVPPVNAVTTVVVEGGVGTASVSALILSLLGRGLTPVSSHTQQEPTRTPRAASTSPRALPDATGPLAAGSTYVPHLTPLLNTPTHITLTQCCVACGTGLNHGATYCHNCGYATLGKPLLPPSRTRAHTAGGQ